MPIQKAATASKLAICVLTLLFFSSFVNQTARESAEIVGPCGILRSVTVVTWKCNNPVYKPPPHFCPMPNASMHKEGRGA